MNRNTSRRQPMPDPPPSSRTNEATVRAALETPASVEDRVAQPPSAVRTSSQEPGANSQKPSIHAAGNNRTTTREVSPGESKSVSPGPRTRAGVARGGVEMPLAVSLESATKAARVASISPSIHAGGNNRTTTREVSLSQSQSAPLGSPTPTAVVSVGAETATGRPNVYGLVPNPQPIPLPSKAELEKMGFRFGPFTPQHNPVDVEMIAHYAKRGYRPLQPHEVDYTEFRSNGVPFALAASVPRRPQPPATASPD